MSTVMLFYAGMALIIGIVFYIGFRVKRHKRLVISKIIAYIQPICASEDTDSCIKEKKYRKFEALMRYPKEDGTYSFPEKLLKKSPSFIQRKATLHMLHLVLDLLEKHPDIELSININYKDVTDNRCRKKILALVDQHKCVADRLIFEFIENAKLKDSKKAIISQFMDDVKKYQCKCALDDFGKDYSTFDPVLSFKFDILKLDRVLCEDFTSDAKKFYLIDMIVNMCQRFDIKTVVEFIRWEKEATSAKIMGIDYIQGNFTGEALPPSNYL